MTDKAARLAKGLNICLIPNWLMLNNAIRSGNLQILGKVLKQEKHSSPMLRPNAQSFTLAIWSGNPDMLEEVVRLAKHKHGLDFIPNRDSMIYAVLCGNPAMVDRLLSISRVRKKRWQVDFELLHCAAWSHSHAMLEKIRSFPSKEKFSSQLTEIFSIGREKSLDKTVLEAKATGGHPGLIDKLIITAKAFRLPVPLPTKKALSNAIKSGNCALVEKILNLSRDLGAMLIIDNELKQMSDWSFNPAMKSYLESITE